MCKIFTANVCLRLGGNKLNDNKTDTHTLNERSRRTKRPGEGITLKEINSSAMTRSGYSGAPVDLQKSTGSVLLVQVSFTELRLLNFVDRTSLSFVA